MDGTSRISGRGRVASLAALAAFLPAGRGNADVQYWDYQDWHVTVETIDGEEDFMIDCVAQTGGDGDPALTVSLFNLDAGPPTNFPAPTLNERAVRGSPTVMQDGQRVVFQTDANWQTEGYVAAGRDEDGFAWAAAMPVESANLTLLQSMRQGRTMWIVVEGEVIYAASMNGFTAAYAKISEQCGFPTTGVID